MSTTPECIDISEVVAIEDAGDKLRINCFDSDEGEYGYSHKSTIDKESAVKVRDWLTAWIERQGK